MVDKNLVNYETYIGNAFFHFCPWILSQEFLVKTKKEVEYRVSKEQIDLMHYVGAKTEIISNNMGWRLAINQMPAQFYVIRYTNYYGICWLAWLPDQLEDAGRYNFIIV